MTDNNTDMTGSHKNNAVSLLQAPRRFNPLNAADPPHPLETPNKDRKAVEIRRDLKTPLSVGLSELQSQPPPTPPVSKMRTNERTEDGATAGRASPGQTAARSGKRTRSHPASLHAK